MGLTEERRKEIDSILGAIEDMRGEYEGRDAALHIEEWAGQVYEATKDLHAALAEAERERIQLRKDVDIWAAVGRSVALWLKEFCDEELPYPQMVREAAMKAEGRVRKLEGENARLKLRVEELERERPARAQKLHGWRQKRTALSLLGSGTTLLVAQRLGWNGIGIDLSESYCQLAVKRLEPEHRQMRLGIRCGSGKNND